MEERPRHHRVLAGLALAALLAAGLHCSWLIYTDRADFSGAATTARPTHEPPANRAARASDAADR